MSTAFEKLKQIVQNDPSLLSGDAAGGDIGQVAAVLENLAREHGLDLTAGQIQENFQANTRDGLPDDELDDLALEQVAGAGSPYCMFTNGCYCFFTK
ncbi:hypothetical protein GCM10011505_44020 [Tistrella bauzanensis]|uniref:Nif11 domain-containing protein n=1 Tax=Tistrella bauzanensis TaxID=657419 RepID=A0ABQ1J648_9PROT|nr:Nif11-like leader peptide family natural product precursor [Tistrella bauzanensis]GGB58338.1 hypothetical protein GCM10011505_44020 [Tistrella bauzanensis]